MKKYLLILTLLLTGFTYPEKPVTRLNDYSNTLTASQKAQLIESLKQIETDTKAQVVVAVFPTIEDNSIEDVANTLGRKWAIGSKERNDGVLLVLAMKEHKMRIEVGYGLEGVLTDAVSNDITRNALKPKLKNNDLFGAILGFSTAVHKVLITGASGQVKTVAAPNEDNSDTMFLIVMGIVGLVGLIVFLVNRNKAKEESPTTYSTDTNATTYSTTNSNDNILAALAAASIASNISSSRRRSDDDNSSSSSSSYSSSSSSDNSSFGGGSSDSGFGGGGGDFGGGGSSDSW